MKRKGVILMLLLTATLAAGCSKEEPPFKHIKTSSFSVEALKGDTKTVEHSETEVESSTEAETAAEIESETEVDDEWTIDELVDTKVHEITDSEEYSNASIEEREQMIGPLLKDLEKLGYIKNLYYDKDNETFTFQYYSGVLGGVMIKEWNPMMN